MYSDRPLMRYADLHLHTVHSDGVRSPSEVVDRAIAARIGIIAISDHDNVAAYREIRDYAEEKAVALIPAAELSALHEGVDVHVLAYAFDPDDVELENRLVAFREMRARRGDQMVDKLIALGHPVSREQVREIAGEGAVGRPHVARALVDLGVTLTVQEAFERFLRPGAPAYVDKERFSIPEVVELVHRSGGLTSIAHPSLYPEHRRLVPKLLDLGVDGLEVFHPDVSDDDRFHYQKLAADRRLLTTGGSDDHGFEGRKTIGSIRVPEKSIRPILERVL